MTDAADRAATAYRARRTDAAFDPARTALLVIDPVNDFLSEGGAAWDLTQCSSGPMAFTAEDYTDHQLQRRSGINRMMHERRMFVAGSWGADFHPDLQPRDDDIVLESHKGIDVFETDLPEHLDRLGTTHLAIAGMTANLCCESTGRHAMERGFHVTYLHDAIGADNVAAYEAATHINYPLVANGIVDVDDFFDAIDNRDRQPHPGDTVLTPTGWTSAPSPTSSPPTNTTPATSGCAKGVCSAAASTSPPTPSPWSAPTPS
jgi:ureidoacrylate peracid hydrolase